MGALDLALKFSVYLFGGEFFTQPREVTRGLKEVTKGFREITRSLRDVT